MLRTRVQTLPRHDVRACGVKQVAWPADVDARRGWRAGPEAEDAADPPVAQDVPQRRRTAPAPGLGAYRNPRRHSRGSVRRRAIGTAQGQ